MAPENADTTPPTDAAELMLRLVEETARRQQAEALAETATATAEAETARAALVDLRATAVQSIAAVRARDRADRMEAMHQGLLALRTDLDGLRAVAEAAIAAAPSVAPAVEDRPAVVVEPAAATTPPAATDPPAPAESTAEATEPSGTPVAAPSRPIAPDLARSAQELLARGRLDVADEVIRGLEDAAARLRAQAPPPAED